MTGPAVATLNDYVLEALQLRFAGGLPALESGPQEVLDTLLEVRRRLDRVEEILGLALRFRGRAARASAVATAEADDAWDQAAQRGRQAPVQRGDEYSSARERHAEANLATVDKRRTARSAAELTHTCDEVVDVLRLTQRGLDGLRHDLLTMLRTLQFESTLER